VIGTKPIEKKAKEMKLTAYDPVTQKSEVSKQMSTQALMSFDFNSPEHFSPDSDSLEVAKLMWGWLLNPIGLPKWKKLIKDHKVVLIQNRAG